MRCIDFGKSRPGPAGIGVPWLATACPVTRDPWRAPRYTLHTLDSVQGCSLGPALVLAADLDIYPEWGQMTSIMQSCTATHRTSQLHEQPATRKQKH